MIEWLELMLSGWVGESVSIKLVIENYGYEFGNFRKSPAEYFQKFIVIFPEISKIC